DKDLKRKRLSDLFFPKTGNDVHADVLSGLSGLVFKLVSFGKQRGLGIDNLAINDDNWQDLIDDYDLISDLADNDGNLPENWQELQKRAKNLATKMLLASNDLAHEVIDFDDMIYCPLFFNFPLYLYSWVLLDEAQDTNRTRRIFALRSIKPRIGRFVAVGDEYQAIYRFTGADNDALDIIINETNAITLPLFTSFRCSKVAAKRAQKINPEFKAHENNQEGSEQTISLAEFKQTALNPADVAICRNIAPLVDLLFDNLKRGIPSQIEGNDIAADLIKFTQQWSKPKTIQTWLEKLDSYAANMCAKWEKQGHESKIEALQDRVDTLHTIARQLPLDSPIGALQAFINGLFVNEDGSRKQCFTLTTVHKSKGREFDTVYLIGKNTLMPSKFARKQEDKEQELHLIYVAETRTKNRIIEVLLPLKKQA
ncbi:MAG: ATP-dependent helicase, partial [Rhodospirillales bacterium]|nr:ATP-dependent helicase [Rhodospirillales bacterium]